MISYLYVQMLDKCYFTNASNSMV